MKLTFFICSLLLLSHFTCSAQTRGDVSDKTFEFGIYGGFIHGIGKTKIKGTDTAMEDSTNSGFIGVGVNSRISDHFYIEPFIQYAIWEEDSFLFIPVHAKYYIGENFNVFLGPQVSLGFVEEEEIPMDNFGLDASMGIGYDFLKNFFVSVRYCHQLTNRTPDPVSLNEFLDDVPSFIKFNLESKVNTFHIAVGYRFM